MSVWPTLLSITYLLLIFYYSLYILFLLPCRAALLPPCTATGSLPSAGGLSINPKAMSELRINIEHSPGPSATPATGTTLKVLTASQSKTTDKQDSETEQKAMLWGFQEGDHKVLRAVYKNDYPQVENYILHSAGNKEEAKDIFQEALLVTYQKVSQPGFCLSCQLSTYIFAVARRLWLKKLRDERPLALQTVGMVDDIEEEGIEELIRRMKRFKLYEDKFAQLSEGCRKLLQLFLQGTPAEVIRQQFGYSSISYTRKRKCQCKAKLIKLVMEAPEYKDLTQHDGS